MDHHDKVRNEPTLADLEAFERLLRDSLKNDRPGSAPAEAAPAVSAAPTIPAPSRAVPQDGSAFDELTRLIEQPLSFDMPTIVATPAPPLASAVTPPAPPPPLEWDEVGLRAPKPATEERTVFMAQPAPGEPDPLMVFEQELRDFDALKVGNAAEIGLRADFAGGENYAPQEASAHHASAGQLAQDQQAEWHEQPFAVPARRAPSSADSLNAAEDRLAAETAAVAASEAPAGAGRSRTIFFGLGGIALAGLAAIGATFALGGKKVDAPKNVPVIAAKQQPTKEAPANPGGMEIPDQNKQVLAPKAAPVETKPAQVVNTTEQPVDLNQATRRDSVRIIVPNPTAPAPGAEPAPAPVAVAAPTAAPAPAPAPAAAAAPAPAASEPRRVQSVKLSDPISPTPQATTPAIPTLPSAGAGAVLAGSAAIGAIAAASAPRAAPATPTTTPAAPAPKAAATQARPPVPAATPASPPAPKAESRPATANAAQAPRPPAPAATAPATPRQANAPISLVNPAPRPAAAPAPRPAAAPSGGAGGFAVQLAARPTLEDARSASSQLGSRYSGALGGKATNVVSGQANGKTVYRIRAGGYSQADANSACERVKAAGGSCFVTRQ